jgi:cytochrome c-type biogenesis protein CcsB
MNSSNFTIRQGGPVCAWHGRLAHVRPEGAIFSPSSQQTWASRPCFGLSVALLFLLVLLLPSFACAADFLSDVDLGPLPLITVQDRQTLKTLDTYARQRLSDITGKSTYEGHTALPVVLDILFRPEAWADKNCIRIKNVPLRKDFDDFPGIGAMEKRRILEQGTISLSFLVREDVQHFLEDVSAKATFKAQAVSELLSAGSAMQELVQAGGFPPLACVPPRVEGDLTWKRLAMIVGVVPRYAEALRASAPNIRPLDGYAGTESACEKALDALAALRNGWKAQDASAVNTAAASFSAALPEINPAVYPAEIKRKTEYYYNRAAKLTIPAAFVYFAAFTLFLMAVYSGASGLRRWGLGLFLVAFAIHTVAIAVRWWLVSKTVGNWFESIPIKNQFESVLFSSWFGGLVGVILELWRGRSKLGGVFGAASSFVGWLSLVAIFSAPFVAGRDIGGEIGMVNGVLMSYWLYIHVTMVTAAYALIGMSFMLGSWWIIKYYAAKARGIGFSLAPAMATAQAPAAPATAAELTRTAGGPSLATLDACNLVILQLAFWVLGVGIILGAVWADQSWGRPWGWDPKETFALVTWIVYLAVVHIRLVTADKAWWTAVLSIVGFFVMLFNWIGVNFFLVGLHSYA